MTPCSDHPLTRPLTRPHSSRTASLLDPSHPSPPFGDGTSERSVPSLVPSRPREVQPMTRETLDQLRLVVVAKRHALTEVETELISRSEELREYRSAEYVRGYRAAAADIRVMKEESV